MFKNLKWFALSSVFALALVSCGGNSPTPEPQPDPKPDLSAVSTVTVAPTTLNLEVGQSAGPLQAVASNVNGDALTGKTFVWNSSDPSIATVTPEGRVKALKGGTVNVNATSEGKAGSAGLNISLMLRIGARAYGSPFTIFVSKADGSLIDSKTIDLADGYKRFTFSDIPGDALVTGAYKMQAPRFTCRVNPCAYVLTDIIRLQSYPVAYANERDFSLGYNNDFIADLQAVIQKPTFANVTQAGGIDFFCCYNNFGTNSSLNLSSGLSQRNLQSDGRYSLLFAAYDQYSNPIAYAKILDKSIPTTSYNDSVAVNATDWKQDFQTTNLTITNYLGGKNASGAKFSYGERARVQGKRKGAKLGGISSRQAVSNFAAKTLTFNLIYPPYYYDTLGYNIRLNQADFTLAGAPSTYTSIDRFDLTNSLPANLTLDTKTDFLQSPTNLSIADSSSAQPNISWVTSGNLSTVANVVTGTTLKIFDDYTGSNPINWNYSWYFDRLDRNVQNLKVPSLPASLTTEFAPTDGIGGKHYSYEVSNFEEAADANLRAFSYLSPSYVAPASAPNTATRTQNLEREQSRPELEPDPFAIQLK